MHTVSVVMIMLACDTSLVLFLEIHTSESEIVVSIDNDTISIKRVGSERERLS